MRPITEDRIDKIYLILMSTRSCNTSVILIYHRFLYYCEINNFEYPRLYTISGTATQFSDIGKFTWRKKITKK